MDIFGLYDFKVLPTVNGDDVVVVTDSVGIFPDLDLTGITTDQGLKWDGAKLIATDFPAGGGTVVAEAESEASSGTTGATWLQKVTINHTFEAGKKYILFWNFEWQNTSTSGDFDGRVQRNNTADSIMDMREEPADGGSDQWMPRSGWRFLDGLTGSQDFDLDYRNNGSGTASIRKARLLLLEVA